MPVIQISPSEQSSNSELSKIIWLFVIAFPNVIGSFGLSSAMLTAMVASVGPYALYMLRCGDHHLRTSSELGDSPPRKIALMFSYISGACSVLRSVGVPGRIVQVFASSMNLSLSDSIRWAPLQSVLNNTP